MALHHSLKVNLKRRKKLYFDIQDKIEELEKLNIKMIPNLYLIQYVLAKYLKNRSEMDEMFTEEVKHLNQVNGY